MSSRVSASEGLGSAQAPIYAVWVKQDRSGSIDFFRLIESRPALDAHDRISLHKIHTLTLLGHGPYAVKQRLRVKKKVLRSARPPWLSRSPVNAKGVAKR